MFYLLLGVVGIIVAILSYFMGICDGFVSFVVVICSILVISYGFGFWSTDAGIYISGLIDNFFQPLH